MKHKEIKEYESDRRGDYSDNLEYVYHNYDVDKKIPWPRYIIMYIIVWGAIVALILKILYLFPIKVNAPYEEPLIIDQMGYFTDTTNLIQAANEFYDNTGVLIAVVTMPRDELIFSSADSELVLCNNLYNKYIDDEYHIFIAVCEREYRGEVSPYIFVTDGKKTVSVTKNHNLNDYIAQNYWIAEHTEEKLAGCLRTTYPELMKVQASFWVEIGVMAVLIIAFALHLYFFVIKRVSADKRRCHSISKNNEE